LAVSVRLTGVFAGGGDSSLFYYFGFLKFGTYTTIAGFDTAQLLVRAGPSVAPEPGTLALLGLGLLGLGLTRRRAH
jgi:PEP-CTERM motif